MIETVNEVCKKVVDSLDENEVIRILQDLIRIPSHSQCKQREKDVAKYIYKYLNDNNVDVVSRDVIGDRPNIIAKISGSEKGKSLMLNGHIDTVPPYNMEIDPFDPVIKAGKMYGRGTCDMKGAIASMMSAILAIQRSGVKLKGDLYFTGVINEELKSEGAEDIVHNGPKTDMAIVGEPTDLQIAAGHKGLEWIEVIIKGKAAHGGTPEKGINAISKAAKFIDLVEEELIPELAERKNELMGPATMNFGKIEGGDQPSTVAGECRIQIDRRWIPEETLDMVFGDFQKLIDKLSDKDPKFKAEIKRIPSNMATMDHMPMEIPRDHNLVKTLETVSEGIIGTKPTITAFRAWTDASLLSNFGKIDTVVYGPGSLKLAHSAVEYVPTKEIVQAAKVYASTALRICGVEP